MNILQRALKHYEQKDSGAFRDSSFLELKQKDAEIRRLQLQNQELHGQYETTILRLKNLVEEMTAKSQQKDTFTKGLQKEIAQLQVNEKNLIAAMALKSQKCKQYSEIALMQLEEMNGYKEKYSLVIKTRRRQEFDIDAKQAAVDRPGTKHA